MKIIPLGTNGFFPSFGRHTACFAIPFGDILIILDAGSGLFRFAEPIGKELLAGVKKVHLYLSHYHMDHTFGFYGAFQLFNNLPVKVYTQSDRKIFSEFARLDYFPINYEKEHRNFRWEKLITGKKMMNGYSVNVVKQNHRGEKSIGFSFSFGVSYITDGEPNNEIAGFAKHSKVFLCESMDIGKKISDNIEDQIEGGHITGIGAAMIAREAKVGKLVLIHHNPYHDSKVLEHKLGVARKIFVNSINAIDGIVIDF